MWFTMIWNYVKNPKNILITVLVAALVFLALYALSLYVGKGIADVKLKKAQQEILGRDQMIANQEARINEFTENLKQIKIAQDKLARIRTTSQQIQTNIEEAKDDKALVGARNDIVDLLYNGMRNNTAPAKAE